MAPALSPSEISRELADYRVVLAPAALEQLSTYLDLLLHWNRRVNLTGIREPRRIVRELFGESLFLAQVVELKGWLVDIGSGAGFPGLALKLVAPDLHVTLVEARQKKGAFLKEAARRCGFLGIDVVAERFETWARGFIRPERADVVTTRAVRAGPPLLSAIHPMLRPGGKLAMFLSGSPSSFVARCGAGWSWRPPIPIPSNPTHVIVIGERR